MEDTIFAPSTNAGGAIALIRVSGKDAFKTEQILSRKLPAQAGLLRFMQVIENGVVLDDAMVACFHAPRSYTGENTVEINCHGGYQTVQKILGALASLGFRPAEGGEFTKRAFLNGKMDLSQAEAVMDIINADAEQSRRVALDQLHGSVSRAVGKIEALLLDALSAIDAAVDFPDEAEEDCLLALPDQIRQALDEIRFLIENGRTGRVLRDGLKVVIIGKPNVGKSSLLNALSCSDRSIVTEIAGTTRDVIDERTAFFGIPVRLIDTAGIRKTEDKVEKIGVERAMEQIESADVILAVLDGSRGLSDEDSELLEIASRHGHRLVVINKSDLERECGYDADILVSAETGEGLDALKRKILELGAPADADNICITNERHLRALERAETALAQAEAHDLTCAATDIRNAMFELGSITGSDVDTDVINRIFERFCVGK